MRRRTLLATLPALAVPRLGTAQALTRASLRLKWLPQTQFAGYYLGLERGYYREAGIDLTINPGGPNLLTENLVAAGGDTFGVSGGTDSVFSAREKGLPITCIGISHQITPFVFVAKADGPVRTLEDFRGRKATAWFTGAQLVLYGMLASRGIRREEVSITPQQVSVTPFVNGETDVCAATWYNELNVLRARLGVDKLRLFVAEDFGITVPRDTVIVNEAIGQRDPRLVEAFLLASIRGWRAAKAEPAAALEATVKVAPTLDRAHQIAMLPEALRLMTSGAAATEGLYWIDPTALARAHDFFVEHRVLAGPIDLAAGYQNRFLEAIPRTERLA